jgi:hypothetical protein
MISPPMTRTMMFAVIKLACPTLIESIVFGLRVVHHGSIAKWYRQTLATL